MARRLIRRVRPSSLRCAYATPTDVMILVDTSAGLDDARCDVHMEYIAETMSGLKGEESGGSDPTVRVAVLEFDGSTRTVIVLDDSDYNLVRKRSCGTRSSVTDLSGFSAHPRGGADRKIIACSNKVDSVSNPNAIASEHTDLLRVEGIDVIMVSAELQTSANFASERIFVTDAIDSVEQQTSVVTEVLSEACSDPTNAPATDPTRDPTRAPTRQACDDELDMDRVFLVDRSCPMTEAECVNQQLLIAEALTAIRGSELSHTCNFRAGVDWVFAFWLRIPHDESDEAQLLGATAALNTSEMLNQLVRRTSQ